MKSTAEYFGLMDDSFESQATVGMCNNLLICLPLTIFFHLKCLRGLVVCYCVKIWSHRLSKELAWLL